MPTNDWDARIKLLYPTDAGTFFTADTVRQDDPFDLIANVEVGSRLHEFSDDHTLSVAVRNLTKSTTILSNTTTKKLPAAAGEHNEELRTQFGAGWGGKADVGDVLEAVASYTVSAGIHTDYSSATSQMFIVVTK